MKSRLLCAAGACIIAIISPYTQAVPVSAQGTWETTLQGRDLDGNAATFEAYYDTTLNITWLADANYARTVGASSNGRMTLNQALYWVNNLNVNGVTGWRIPTMLDTGRRGCTAIALSGTDCGFNVQTGSAATTVYSEMASLFYDTLGNLAQVDAAGNAQSGAGLTNSGPFSNFVENISYWSGPINQADFSGAWTFRGLNGKQEPLPRSFELMVIPVRSGDISTVPVPAALWLFGSGLLGLVGIARRKMQPLPT